jgi:hypothetical protein
LPHPQLIGHTIADIKITYVQSATFPFPFPASLQPVGTGSRKSIPSHAIHAESLALECLAHQAINLRDRAYLGVPLGRWAPGAEATNRIYLDTARLLTRVAPLVLVDDTFVLKGGTAINLFVRDMPRLSVDLDLMFPD